MPVLYMWRLVPSHHLRWPLSGEVKYLVQEGGPFQGLRVCSCLTFGNELSEETQVLTKQETLSGRGACVESRRVKETRKTALPCGLHSRVFW